MKTLNNEMKKLIDDLNKPHSVEQYKKMQRRFDDLVVVYRCSIGSIKQYGRYKIAA